MSPPFVDLTGKTFNRWTVLEKTGATGTLRYHTTYLCLCECGTKRVVEGYSLVSGNSKSCGCWAVENARTKLRVKPYWALYQKLKGQANQQNHELKLSYEDFVELTNIKTCVYCEETVTWGVWAFNGKSIGGYNLDRKDNNQGYLKENVVVCCGLCNLTRGDRFTHEEFLILGKTIKSILRSRKKTTL